ncbi:hypothetical protein ACS3SW_08360 [Roseobacteraceae bacterium S113]
MSWRIKRERAAVAEEFRAQNSGARFDIGQSLTQTGSNAELSAGGVATEEEIVFVFAAADLPANDTDPDAGVMAISAVSGMSALTANVSLNGDGSVRHDATSSNQFDQLAEGAMLADSVICTILASNDAIVFAQGGGLM